MPFCTNCGKQIPSDVKFCPECGAPATGAQPQGHSSRKHVFEGEIRKCPNCGEILSAFEVTCHSCGFELRNVEGSTAVRELSNAIAKLESTRAPIKNSFMRALSPTADPTDKSIANVINSFVIPNTKEDILEFMILAANSIDVSALDHMRNQGSSDGLSRNLVANAWVSKFEQSYQKAKIAFGKSPEFNEIEELYTKKQREIHRGRTQSGRFLIGAMLLFAIMIALLMILALWTNAQEEDISSRKNTVSSSASSNADNVDDSETGLKEVTGMMQEDIQDFTDGLKDYQDSLKEYSDTLAGMFSSN